MSEEPAADRTQVSPPDHQRHGDTAAQQRRTTVLAVDDDETNLEILQELFEHDYALSTATSGEQALAQIEQGMPDIILLDVMMPGIDGYETCRQIRSRPDGGFPKVLLVSARAMPEDILRGYDAGADDYISKPFVHAELRAKVRVFERLCSVEELLAVRTARTTELEHALAASNAATEAKSTFLANVSHELRTPMTAVLGFAEMLQERLSATEDKELLETVLSNGNYLLHLLNDILDVARIESGRMQVEYTRIAPQDLLRDVWRLLQGAAMRKGLELRLELDSDLPKAIATDAMRLRQILINLVGNAIKFTEHGSVVLRAGLVTSDDNVPQLMIECRDTGPGISPAMLTQVFEPFTQADATTTREHGGTGLGLNISRGFARALGGDVTAVSQQGVGSAFFVTVGCGMLDDDDEGLTAPATEQRRGADDHTALRGAQILLAEDTPANQRLITHVLSRAGAKVHVVDNGAEALAAVAQAEQQHRAYDLIVMDVQMPVMGGLEATQNLRGHGFAAPIVALTASVDPAVQEQCHTAGCDAFAPKPIAQQQLLADLARLIEEHRGNA